jgi:hypothetical protein
MGVWTTAVHDWTAGEQVTAANMDAQLRDFANAFGAWTSYAVTLGAWTAGNGTTYGYYQRVQKTVRFKCGFTFGSTSAAAASSPTLTLPVACGTTGEPCITGRVIDNGTNYYKPFPVLASTTTVGLYLPGTNGVWVTPSTTVPFTWTTGDSFHFAGSYEVA